MQSLALLRWLGSGCHSIAHMALDLSVQHVPIVRQLGQGLGMQGAHLRQLFLRQVNEAGVLELPSSSSARRFPCNPSPLCLPSDCRVNDGPLRLTDSCLSSLVRLRSLHVQACTFELGSSCGQLAALQDLSVHCGLGDPVGGARCLLLPCTVATQPGAIPPSLISMRFRCCAMPELPAALCAATGLRELRVEDCAVCHGQKGITAAPYLAPTLGSLTSLTWLTLQLMDLTEQPSFPGLLSQLTGLRHLDMSESVLCDGGEQALCSAFQQLSSLTLLSLDASDTVSYLQAAPASLPALSELRLVMLPHCDDHRLPALAAAPHLDSLMVCGSTLLCEENMTLLRELPELCDLAVV